jgi:serine/threonine-protein kinase
MSPDFTDTPDLQNDRYRLVELIGSGAVATVWRAEDAETGTPVAIKLMRPETTDLEDVQRLAQEVEILKKLSHPCIVKLHGTGVARQGNPYVVMEAVEGIDLRGKLEATPVLPPGDVADIVGQVCSALAEAHEHGVIHRDIKPENVLLCAPEHIAVKMVDFGMAKVLAANAPSLTFGERVFGTPAYMAPERALGKRVTAASDVYGVAAMTYEMLEGRRPFTGVNPIQVMTRQVQEPPPPMQLAPAAVARAVLDGLSKEPSERPTARRFSQALARAVDATGSG